MTLPIAEIFGPTIQGEGPAAGRAAWFVRFGGCNLSCSWCDTPYTWDGTRFDLRQEITPTEVYEIVDRIPPRSTVVLTGGEPLIQQRNPAWLELLAELAERGCEVHVETNGTIRPTLATISGVDLFVVSPKLPHAGPHRGRQNPAMAPGWAAAAELGRAHLKVVCRDAADVRDAVALAHEGEWPMRQVWVMPEGTTATALAPRFRELAEAASQYGVNVSHRLHVLAWGDERGR